MAGREDSNLRMTESKSVALPLGDAPSRRVIGRHGAVKPSCNSRQGAAPAPPTGPSQCRAAVSPRPRRGTGRSRWRRSRSCAPAGIQMSRNAASTSAITGQNAIAGGCRSLFSRARSAAIAAASCHPAGNRPARKSPAAPGTRGSGHRDAGIDQHDAAARQARRRGQLLPNARHAGRRARQADRHVGAQRRASVRQDRLARPRAAPAAASAAAASAEPPPMPEATGRFLSTPGAPLGAAGCRPPSAAPRGAQDCRVAGQRRAERTVHGQRQLLGRRGRAARRPCGNTARLSSRW